MRAATDLADAALGGPDHIFRGRVVSSMAASNFHSQRRPTRGPAPALSRRGFAISVRSSRLVGPLRKKSVRFLFPQNQIQLVHA